MPRTPTRTPTASLLPGDFRPAMVAFLDYIQAECGLADNTRRAYGRDLIGFGSFLVDDRCGRLSDLTGARIERFIGTQSEAGKSPASIARSLAAVRMFCRFCVLERFLSEDPSQAVERPKGFSRLPGTLSRQAVGELLAAPAPDRDAHWLRDRAILTLLYATGMRASELAGTKLADVNFGLGVIRVLGKGAKERIVPAAEAALDLLKSYADLARPRPRAGDEDVLFLSRTGRRLAREDVFRIVRKYARLAAIRGRVGPHTLRHCFATQMLSGGADLRSLQDMLGHVDVATTQIYTHVDASRLKAIHKKFHPRG